MKKYRADIDGLRAIAVLPVILFHAGVPGFSGGFVGVDVFFVISGFLITSILIRDIDARRFSILRFYERRFKRLLPALFTVFLFTAVVAWPVASPDDLKSLGRQVFSASVFSSNIYFWLTDDYFGRAAHELVLLHTWSLAVEEQFYLFFPPFLMLLGAGSRYRRGLITTIGAFSLIGCVVFTSVDPSGAFYLLPFRAWEMMAGAGLAVMGSGSMSKRAATGLGAASLAILLATTYLYTGATPFPGFAAIPVIGASVLLLAIGQANPDNPVSGWLRIPVFVWIGKMSYSLYLWHWPCLLLASRYIDAGLPASPLSRVVGVGVSFVLGWASWRFVENPIRRLDVSRNRTLVAGVMASTLFAGAALLVQARPRILCVWTPDVMALFDTQRGPMCTQNPDMEECTLSGKRTSPRVALWGDSHAQALIPAIRQWDGPVDLYLRVGCPPLMGVERRDLLSSCKERNDEVFRQISTSEADVVVLAARWPLGTELTKPEDHETPDFHESGGWTKESFGPALHRTVKALLDQDKRVVVLSASPEFPWRVPDTVALHHVLRRGPPALARHVAEKRNARVDEALERLKPMQGVLVIDVRPILCDDARCPTDHGTDVLYADAHHLSTSGAIRVAPALMDALRRSTGIAID